MFDRWFGSRGEDHRLEGQRTRVERDRRRKRRRCRRCERPAVDLPDPHLAAELSRAPGHDTGAGSLDEHVHALVGALLAGPRQRGAQDPVGSIGREYPRLTLPNEGGAVAKRAQNARTLARMIADEGIELGGQQRAVALRVDGHAFLAPLRCP